MVSLYEEYVVQAILNYYNHDYDMFFEYLDDNVIWYGPKQGQYIVGKENLRHAIEQSDNKDFRFRLENTATKMLTFYSNVYSLMVTYQLISYAPNGVVRSYLQHLIIIGQKCRDRDGEFFWRCSFIHVSNTTPDGKASGLEMNTPKQISALAYDLSRTKPRKRLIFPGDNYTSLYLPEDSIRYVVGGKGVLCYIHTDTDVFLVHQLLKDVEKKLPDYYYRCHSSYIINLRHVLYLSGHKITMVDGTEIPIPLKRFQQIKKEIDMRMQKGFD